MEHAFVIDLTKERFDSRKTIAAVSQYAAGYKPTAMLWVARKDQREVLGPVEVHEDEPDPDLPGRIRALVQHMSQNGASGSTIHVISYEGKVLAAVSALNGPDCTIISQPLRSIVEPHAGRGAPRPAESEPYDPRRFGYFSATGGLPVAEAIEVAKRALREGGHTSPSNALYQTDLRHRMVYIDHRARKNPRDPISRDLIRTVVQSGLRDGWLGQNNWGRPGSELVWLIENSLTTADAPTNEPVTSNTSGDRAVSPSTTKPDQPPVNEGKVFHRRKYQETGSGQMELILRQEEIGSHAALRPLLFTALRQVLAEHSNGIRASFLWPAVAEKAAALAEERQVGSWDRVTECFLNMIFGAGILFTDGILLDHENRPIPFDLGRWSATIHSFNQEDLELKAEAYLAYRIICEKGGLKSKEDFLDLGLALYQQGKESGPKTREIKINTAALITFLEQVAGRVSVDGVKITPTEPKQP